jgi:hypothetical protein
VYFNPRLVKLPENTSPKLIVVIDTEEEFDWSCEPRRDADSILAMSSIEKVQNIFDSYLITPCYVVDYPVASRKEGYQVLKEIYQSGRCEIGAHLHPWVNPPYVENLSRKNTFPGNLPLSQEKEKLKILCETINESFGIEPKIYKAGRYGFGHNTTTILEEFGFEIDLSVCPPVDHTDDGGPDYSHYTAEPYWFGKTNILEIPVTGAYVGWAGTFSHSLYELANRLKLVRGPALLSRIAAVDRLILSPEGYNTNEHIKLTYWLYKKGVRTFTWSFHNTSLLPGCTPYVKSNNELNRFLDLFKNYFDFFFDELMGEATTPTIMKSQLEQIS